MIVAVEVGERVAATVREEDQITDFVFEAVADCDTVTPGPDCEREEEALVSVAVALADFDMVGSSDDDEEIVVDDDQVGIVLVVVFVTLRFPSAVC